MIFPRGPDLKGVVVTYYRAYIYTVFGETKRKRNNIEERFTYCSTAKLVSLIWLANLSRIIISSTTVSSFLKYNIRHLVLIFSKQVSNL